MDGKQQYITSTVQMMLIGLQNRIKPLKMIVSDFPLNSNTLTKNITTNLVLPIDIMSAPVSYIVDEWARIIKELAVYGEYDKFKIDNLTPGSKEHTMSLSDGFSKFKGIELSQSWLKKYIMGAFFTEDDLYTFSQNSIVDREFDNPDKLTLEVMVDIDLFKIVESPDGKGLYTSLSFVFGIDA